MAKFVTIGERLSTTAPAVNKAFTERDPEPIIKRAKQQLDAGATYLDVNIGPAENDGEDIMKWAVELLQSNFDNVPLALRVGADGVHVGQDDMGAREARRILGPAKIIGVSAHDPAEAQKAYADGADYLGCGAMFATATKTNVQVRSRETLAAVCASVPIPVVAIGGISRQNLLTLAGCGEAGVALVSAIFAADDIEQECRELLALTKQL